MPFFLMFRMVCDLCASELTVGSSDFTLEAPPPWRTLTPEAVYAFALWRPEHPMAFCCIQHAQEWAEAHRHPSISSITIEPRQG